MANRGSIEARLTLNNLDFYKNLNEALKRANQAAAELRKTFGQEVKMPSLPRAERGDTQAATARKQAVAEIRQVANQVNLLKVSYEKGDVSQDQFIAGMRDAVGQAERLRSTYAQSSAEFGRLTNVVGIGARSITTAEGGLSRLGISQQVAIGTTQKLGGQFVALQGAIAPLLGVVGLGGLLGITNRLATESNRVNVSYDILQLTLARTGQSGEAAQRAIQNVSATLGVAEGQVVEYVTQLSRIGFTAEQSERALIAGGASALAFGKTAAQGLEGVTSALVTQNSAQLNTIGIAENIGSAMSKAAAANAGYGEEAANAAAAQAGLAIILKATVSEVDSLDKLNGGLAGSQNRAATAAFNARKEFGELLIPLETLKNDTIAGVLGSFNQLPAATQASVGGIGGVTVAVSALATAFTVLRPILAATFLPPAGLVIAGVIGIAALSTALITNKDYVSQLTGEYETYRNGLRITTQTEREEAEKQLQTTKANAIAKLEILKTAIKDGENFSRAVVNNPIADFLIPGARVEVVGDQDLVRQADELQGMIEQINLDLKNVTEGAETLIIAPDVQVDVDIPTDVVDKYAASLRSAQQNAAQSQISAMQEGTAKIQQQRDFDLIVARLAFDESVAELEKGSKRYNGFLAAYNQETSAINTRATADLQREGEARVKAAQTLVSDIDKLKSDVATADAEASGNVIAAITARSTQASRQLEQERQTMLARVEGDTEESRAQILSINASYDDRERQLGEQLTRDLTSEAQRRAATLQSIAERTASIRAQAQAARQRDNEDDTGAIQTELNARLAEIQSGLDREIAAEGRTQAEITALHRQANAERVSAREDAARQTETIVKAEAEAATAVLEASSKSLQQAQLAGVEGAVPKLRATFEAEQQERRSNNAKTLEDFTGNSQDRSRLIQQQGQIETTLTRQNQLQVNQAAREGQEAYLQAVKDYNGQVAEAQRAARQQEIANLQAVLDARRTAAEQQAGSSDARTQAAGYTALIAVQGDALALAKQVTAAERERGASASEIVSALSAEAEAQRAVVGAVQGQIDALKTLRDKQLEIINSGSQVLEFARTAAELSGTDFNQNDAGAAIRAQVEAQAALFQAQVEANKPLAERLETLKLIQQSEKELADLGQQSGLTGEDRQLISEDSAASLAAYPEQAATALEQIGSLDASIAALGVTLQGATGELQTLLEAAGSDEGLNVAVKVEIDRGALAAAEQTLRETFGDAAGNRIVEASTNAGTRAGRGLLTAFTSGIRTNQPGLLSEVDRLLQQVRDRLPSSDAKVGALSDLTYSGSKLPETFAKGILKGKGSVISAADIISRAARPSLSVPSIPTSRALSYPAGGGAGGKAGDTFHIAVDGRNGGQVNGILGLSAKSLARDIQRELRVREG